MNTAIYRLFWELVWRNRVVFPALVLLLGVGGILAQALSKAPVDVWWVSQARGITLAAFLASLILGIAPFTLMEHHSGWRMNSTTTRWFVLPVRTGILVAVPLGFAWMFVGLLLGAWTPVLHRAFGPVDMSCFTVVFLLGVTAAQALAWSIPRKPSQYWVLVTFIFLGALLASVMLQESRRWQAQRTTTLAILATLIPVLGLFSWWVAGRNRCGDWAGEVPLAGAMDLLRRPWFQRRAHPSPMAAMIGSDVLPLVRTFLVSWIGLIILIGGWACLSFWLRRPDIKINWHILGRGLSEAMPFFGVFWLMVWGLLLAGEPGMGFSTRLTGFRATHPVSLGLLAGMRLAPLLLSWFGLWLPLVALHQFFLRDGQDFPPRMAEELARSATALLAARMAFSANAMIGALPLLLRGRFDGFPNVFLATLMAWTWTWLLTGFAYQVPSPAWLGWALGSLLGIKVTTAVGVLAWSWRLGHVTWRYPALLFGCWLLTTGSLLGLFSVVSNGGWIQAMALATTMPLARLACCPIALGANRHR